MSSSSRRHAAPAPPSRPPLTAAERQARRRQRLARGGLVRVDLVVPAARVGDIRAHAAALRANRVPATADLRAVLAVLKRLRPRLERRGVLRVGVFGSVARGDQTAASDIDIGVAVDPRRLGDILDLVAVGSTIRNAIGARVAGARVDVADLATLKPAIRRAVEAEIVYAF
jgi:predicted nucleotidyltransferase